MQRYGIPLEWFDDIENDSLKLDDGTEVQISKCPNGHGKIKSPLCCGQDMACTA